MSQPSQLATESEVKAATAKKKGFLSSLGEKAGAFFDHLGDDDEHTKVAPPPVKRAPGKAAPPRASPPPGGPPRQGTSAPRPPGTGATTTSSTATSVKQPTPVRATGSISLSPATTTAATSLTVPNGGRGSASSDAGSPTETLSVNAFLDSPIVPSSPQPSSTTSSQPQVVISTSGMAQTSTSASAILAETLAPGLSDQQLMVEQLTQMSAKLGDAKMANAELRDEVNRLKRELRDSDTRSSPNHSRHTAAADAALVKRAEDAEDKYTKLKASINFSQMEKLGVEVKKLRMESEAYLTQAEERAREARSLNTQINEADRTITKLQTEVTRLTQEITNTRSQLESSRRVSADFETQLKESRAREAQLIKEGEEAKAGYEADMKHATNIWESKVNEAKAEKTRVAGQAASLKKDYQRLVQKEQIEEQLAAENIRLKEELARKTSSLLDALASLEVINSSSHAANDSAANDRKSKSKSLRGAASILTAAGVGGSTDDATSPNDVNAKKGGGFSASASPGHTSVGVHIGADVHVHMTPTPASQASGRTADGRRAHKPKKPSGRPAPPLAPMNAAEEHWREEPDVEPS